VVKVRRYGVNTASEIAVMGEVNLVTVLETLRNRQSQEPFTPERMTFFIILVFF